MNAPRGGRTATGLSLAALALVLGATACRALVLGAPLANAHIIAVVAALALVLVESAARGLALERSAWGHAPAALLGTLLGLGALAPGHTRELGAGALLVLGWTALAFVVDAARERARLDRASGVAPGSRPAALVLAGALALAALAPLPIVRAAAIGLALMAAARRRTSWTFSRDAAGLWALAIVVGALVIAAGTKHEGTLARAGDVAFLALAAAAWIAAAARPGEVSLGADAPLWPEALAILALLLLSAGPLGSSIGFRGDESSHASRLQFAISAWNPLEPRGLVVAFAGNAVAAPLLALATRRLDARRRLLLVPVGALLAGAALGLLDTAWRVPPGALASVRRYFDLELWPQALLAFAPIAGASPELLYDTGWSRLLPLVATLALVWAAARFVPLPPAGRLLAALALLTIPNVRYYATLLYLEMPFVAAMTFVLVDLARERPPGGLSRGLGLLALLLVPFTKDTALPFFALAAVHALACGWLEGAGDRRATRRALGRTALVFLLPVVLALGFRDNSGRQYAPALQPLVDPGTYRVLGRALVDQYGLFLLLVPVGAVRAWRRGRSDLALLCLGLLGGYTASLALDGGFCLFIARFTLVLLPPFLALALEALASEPFRRARVWAPVLVAIVGANVLECPVGLRGEREPDWGVYMHPEQEYIYPLDEAFGLLAAQNTTLNVKLVGFDYDHPFGLYALKHGGTWQLEALPYPWSINAEAFRRTRIERRTGLDALPSLERLRADLGQALEQGPTAVVVALPPGDLVSEWPERAGSYARTELRKGTCRLVVYRRAPE